MTHCAAVTMSNSRLRLTFDAGLLVGTRSCSAVQGAQYQISSTKPRHYMFKVPPTHMRVVVAIISWLDIYHSHQHTNSYALNLGQSYRYVLSETPPPTHSAPSRTSKTHSSPHSHLHPVVPQAPSTSANRVMLQMTQSSDSDRRAYHRMNCSAIALAFGGGRPLQSPFSRSSGVIAWTFV